MDIRLMQVNSIAECSKESILQFFRPELSYHLSLRSLFCLSLSDAQDICYCTISHISTKKDSDKPTHLCRDARVLAAQAPIKRMQLKA